MSNNFISYLPLINTQNVYSLCQQLIQDYHLS